MQMLPAVGWSRQGSELQVYGWDAIPSLNGIMNGIRCSAPSWGEGWERLPFGSSVESLPAVN